MKNDTLAGSVFKIANNGIAKIIAYHSYSNVLVELSHGHKRTVQMGDLRRGNVKDYMTPTIYGVGFIGNGPRAVSINKVHTKCYKVWTGIIQRCYSERLHKVRPTYKDCTVCDEWLNYQVFAEWFELNYIKGFDLDKDIKIDGNKMYGPETCLFVSPKDNAIKAAAKSYKLKDPNGEVKSIYNLSEFCARNGLTSANIHKVLNGARSHHKGWTSA